MHSRITPHLEPSIIPQNLEMLHSSPNIRSDNFHDAKGPVIAAILGSDRDSPEGLNLFGSGFRTSA